MDSFIKRPTHKCPQENANFLSKFSFWWTRKLLLQCAQDNLELDDIFYPLDNDQSEWVTYKLERAWKKEEEKYRYLEYAPGPKNKSIASEQPSLLRAICVVFWWDYFKAGIGMVLMSAVLRSLQPFLLRGIISHFSASGSKSLVDQETALYYVTGLILTSLAVISLNHHSFLHAQKIAMRVRVACSSLIYRKILRLSKSSLNQTSPRQIVNLLSNDVTRFDILAGLLNHLWIMPIQVCVIGTVMYTIIGFVAFPGLFMLLLIILPIQFIIGIHNKSWRRNIAILTGRRIQLMNELISQIQVVKMYAWETPFLKKVSSARFLEMKAIRNATYLRSLSLSISMFSDKLNLFLTLLMYVLAGNTLTAEIVFTIGMYFNILQRSSAIFFPQAVIQAGETVVSIKRLQNFLLLDELTIDEKIPNEKKFDPLYESQGSSTTISSMDHLPRIKEISEEEVSSANENENSKLEEAVFIELQQICANWKISQLPPTLCDVSFKISGGELCALVGQMGSGKSSLLHILLKELPIGSGNLYLRQRFDTDIKELFAKRGYVADNPKLVMSYSSQEPWIFTGTIRQNILFGEAYDPIRYHEVTKACALWRDMRQWSKADMTHVAGITLTEGQKARINLARAVYKKADVYLLDDPLSAVDQKVSRQLFKRCINGFLRGKTRILVTHQVQILKNTDTIVVLDRGLVKAQGTFEDLSNSNREFITLLNKLKKTREFQKKAGENGIGEIEDASQLVELNYMTRWDSVASVDSLTLNDLNNFLKNIIPSVKLFERAFSDWAFKSKGSFLDHTFNSNQAQRLLYERTEQSISEILWSIDYTDSTPNPASEFSPKEEVSSRVWSGYFRAGGSLLFVMFILFIFVIAQMSLSGTDIWVGYWSNLELIRSSLDNSEIGVTVNEYNSFVNATIFSYFGLLDADGLLPRASAINIYTSLVLASVVFNLVRSFMFFSICMRASDNLHNWMFGSVLHATMRFFSGKFSSTKIINRFYNDVATMDELLPRALMESVNITLLMLSVLLTVIVINPWMTLPVILLIVALYSATILYFRIARSVRKIEGVCKSPVFLQVNATLKGLATIRCAGTVVTQNLRRQFDIYQDVHSGAWYLNIVASASFGLWLDLFSLTFVALLCFTLVLLEDDNIFGGTAGLVISQALQLTCFLQFGIKQTAATCTFMTPIERILQYIDVESEGSPTSDNPPASNWPTKGRISMKNVYFSHTDDLPAVKCLNLTIEPGWKVGVVSRGGVGKDLLISALFRLDNESLLGEIKIDGRDTGNLGLEELRSRISIIPRDSVLFSGTVRYNLDPFGCYEDSALWDVLRQVDLSNLSLDFAVSEGGLNFGNAQRQLICLARAILINNRILVVDEGTGTIDARTNALIQKTLKTTFARHTVITVANRLATIIESDRIILMDKGEVIEFGCPYELLCDNPSGPFAEMVHQAGPAIANNLIHLAESACRQVPPQHSLDLASSEEHLYLPVHKK